MADINSTIRCCRDQDYPWIIKAHLQHYSTVEGFDSGFKHAVTEAIESFKTSPHSINQAFVLEQDESPAGCIFCLHESEGSARIKLFYLDKDLRGQGYGARLLTAAIDHIEAHDYKTLVVSTYSTHVAACALYGRTGFNKIGEKNVHAFGRQLTEQHWQLKL